jgi:hypothetical protein
MLNKKHNYLKGTFGLSLNTLISKESVLYLSNGRKGRGPRNENPII